MSKILLLEKQHEGIKKLINDITDSMKNKDISELENAKEIRKQLSLLAGKLRIHMSREDNFLYPQLLESDKLETKEVVNMFIDEMGHLADEFKKFNEKFLRYSLIVEKEDEFREALTIIFDALERRIEREDKELYPLSQDI